MQKKSLLMLSALSLSLICSCASAPDVPICVPLSYDKGYCVNTVSDKEQIVDDTNKINGKTWWEMKPEMVWVPADSWKEIKTAFIKICKKYGNCSKDITKYEKKMDKLKEGK